MTVKELIDALYKQENKDLPVQIKICEKTYLLVKGVELKDSTIVELLI